jgi:hypothetical protein
MMQINWIFSASYNPGPEIDLDAIQNIGPSWGSWRSWRACKTNNVICHDRAKSNDLLARSFQSVCNFYIPKTLYQEVGRPIGVRLYDGDFRDEVDDLEDIIAMHLVSANSNIVLMAGFDFSEQDPKTDKLEQHRAKNRLGLIYQIIADCPEIQFVLVDHPKPVNKTYSGLSNLTCDVMKNVLKLLS